MVIQKRTQIFLVLLVLALVSSLHIFKTLNTSAISRACQNSPECLAAVAAEEAASAAASSASATASAYEREVAYKNAEIATRESQIAQTRAQIETIISEIDAAKAKLTNQQNILAHLLIDMYFNSNNDPVLMLAGSNTISELAEKEAREDTMNNQISAANRDIIALKEELEIKKQQQEDNLAAQILAEEQLKVARAELQELVDKYSADAAGYEAQAQAAREAQKAAEKAEQEAHPELYRIGSFYGSYDTYEWQNYCPEYQDYFITYIDGYPVGGYVCECVGYAGWKAYEQYGVYLSWGNANTWDDYGRASYVVDHIPSANSIGQADSGYYGHVWWVESVNADGSVNVTEYNNAWATYLYSGDYHFGDFGARTIPAYEASQYNYIHLDQPL